VQQRPHRDSHPFASKNSHLRRQGRLTKLLL
jgi:hypothetical protein